MQAQRTAALPRSSSGSLVELGGMQGRLSKEITPSRKKLIDQGLHSLLENVIRDLKVCDSTANCVRPFQPYLKFDRSGNHSIKYIGRLLGVFHLCTIRPDATYFEM